MRPRRKICVVLVDRANYGRLWPVMKAIEAHPALELQVLCAGTMLLERFGQAVDIVRADGFTVDSCIYMELEGSVPATMAKSTGFAIIEMASEFQRLQPDLVMLIGDRYEALAAAVASAYQNIPLAHIQGGEVSGSIDECARHAITRFAQFHFPATRRAAEYLVRMGENPEHVFKVGCPVGDYIVSLNNELPGEIFSSHGVGAPLDSRQPFFLVIFHPVTTEYGRQEARADEILAALHDIGHPTVWLWPNIDAGSDHISKSLRRYRELNPENSWLLLIKNFSPETFQRTLKGARCAIGNSSSFIRDSTFSGTPVVLVGDRQLGREIDRNITFAECEAPRVKEAVLKQCEHGRYPPSTLYGDGQASPRIAQHLAEVDLFVQKRLHYIFEEPAEKG